MQVLLTSYQPATIAGMPYASTGDPWKCMFAREDLVKKFFPNEEDIPWLSTDDVLPNATKDQVIAKDNEKGIGTA